MHNNASYGYSHYGAQHSRQAPQIPNANRLIYVKQGPHVQQQVRSQTILFNPKFMANKVFVNPNFNQQKAAATIDINPRLNVNISPPKSTKIHINPNTKRLQMPFISQQQNSVHINPKSVQTPVIDIKTPNVPLESSGIKENIPFVLTKTKLIRAPPNASNKDKKQRRRSVNSKYKIVKSGLKLSPKNKFKIDKRKSILVPKNNLLNLSALVKSTIIKNSASSVVNINGRIYKKSKNSLRRASIGSVKEISKKIIISKSQYKLVNKSLSPGRKIVAEAKNKRKILQSQYKLINKSISLSMKNKNFVGGKRKVLQSQYKIVNKSISPFIKNKKLVGDVRNFKIVRRQISKKRKISERNFKKCNFPCLSFRKYGLCKRKDKGKCSLKHDPDQVALCTRFLQGACLKEHCFLSHNVLPEKMATCKYYLEGTCSKENCPYLHVKISPKAEVCNDFLEGFCNKAAQCEKRHQYLCPDYEKNGKCIKPRCEYPHGKMVRTYLLNKNQFAKKCFTSADLKSKNENQFVKTGKESTDLLSKSDDEENARYYVENDSDPNKVINGKVAATLDAANGRNSKLVGSNSKPKMESLPSFIAFSES